MGNNDLKSELEAMFLAMFGGEHAKEIALTDYVLFDEAADWIAFGTYSWPAVGPTKIVQMLIQADFLEWQETQRREQEIKFEFARDQLFAAAGKGRTMLIGKPSAEDVERRSTNDVKIRGAQFYEIVPGELLKEGDWSENLNGYRIGERNYDALFVRLQDLDQLFGAFHSDAASPLNMVGNYGAHEPASEVPEKQRGRRPKWDWDSIVNEIVVLANTPDGLPEIQADLERWVAELCMRKFGNHPSTSLIRSKVSPIYERLGRKSQ